MKKAFIASAAVLISGALLLVGCTERGSSSAPGAGLDSFLTISENSVSDVSSESSSVDSSSESTESSSEQSSAVSAAPVPVEFNDEDREVQEILSGMEDTLLVVSRWLEYDEPKVDEPVKCKFFFPESEYNKFQTDGGRGGMVYYEIPNGYSEYGMEIPQTFDDFKELLLSLVTEEFTDQEIQYTVAKGSITEKNGDVFSVILDEDCKGSLSSRFIEVDGKMYRQSGEGGKGLGALHDINSDSVKVIRKTDDLIEFTFLVNGVVDDDGKPLYLNDIERYKRKACVGVLKYERGGWKRDWDVDLRERWNEYHEQNSSAE